MKKYRWPSVWAMDYVDKGYHYGVEKAGAIPIGLHNTASIEMLEEYLDMVDGIVFTGGTDVNSNYFNQPRNKTCSRFVEPRDRFEIELAKLAVKRKIPLYCICRGHQVLNIAMRGTLYQDVGLLDGEVLRHPDIREGLDSFHFISIGKDTLLYDIIRSRRIKVNSAHHQVVDRLGEGLTVAARSSDGVIEALDMADHPFILSAQWHPERMQDKDHARRMFSAFVDSAMKYKRGTLR